MNARDEEQPCTPPRPIGNAGAGRSESDGEMDSDLDEDSDEKLHEGKKKRKLFSRREVTLIKR